MSEEVDAGSFAVGSSFLVELCIELFEEPRVDPDGSTLTHRSVVAAGSVDSMWSSALARIRARNSGGTSFMSVTTPVRAENSSALCF